MEIFSGQSKIVLPRIRGSQGSPASVLDTTQRATTQEENCNGDDLSRERLNSKAKSELVETKVVVHKRA
jgi:hypothetical protein